MLQKTGCERIAKMMRAQKGEEEKRRSSKERLADRRFKGGEEMKAKTLKYAHDKH